MTLNMQNALTDEIKPTSEFSKFTVGLELDGDYENRENIGEFETLEEAVRFSGVYLIRLLTKQESQKEHSYIRIFSEVDDEIWHLQGLSLRWSPVTIKTIYDGEKTIDSTNVHDTDDKEYAKHWAEKLPDTTFFIHKYQPTGKAFSYDTETEEWLPLFGLMLDEWCK